MANKETLEYIHREMPGYTELEAEELTLACMHSANWETDFEQEKSLKSVIFWLVEVRGRKERLLDWRRWIRAIEPDASKRVIIEEDSEWKLPKK